MCEKSERSEGSPLFEEDEFHWKAIPMRESISLSLSSNSLRDLMPEIEKSVEIDLYQKM